MESEGKDEVCGVFDYFAGIFIHDLPALFLLSYGLCQSGEGRDDYAV